MCTSLATLISTMGVTVVTTQMTSSLTEVRTMGYTTVPITTTSTAASEWEAINTATPTVEIRDLVGVPTIDTMMALEIIAGEVVKVAATITKWIVTMEVEDTAGLVEAPELEKMTSSTSV